MDGHDHSHHDHAAHSAAAAAASTVATIVANATAAVANAASNVVQSAEAQDVADFLSALSPPAAGKDGHDHAGHGGHGDHSALAGHGGHDAHGGMAGHHMMKMWFHGGCEEVILFDWWRTNDCLSLLLSCVVIFVMGALYEGVKWFRVYLQMSRERAGGEERERERSRCGETTVKSNGCRGDNVPLRDVSEEQVYGPTSTPPVPRKGIRIASGRDGAFSLFRLVEAALYSLQLVLAYWLMLIVMTYNTWLTIAVIAGAAFGHWLFAILNILSPSGDRHDSFTTDACH